MKLPRIRFSLRRMMVAVAVFAVAFAALVPWMKGDWNQWRQWRYLLSVEMTWIQSTAGEFYPKDSLKKYTANSLLKVSEPGVPDRRGCYDRQRWWLGQGGELGHHRLTVTLLAGQGGGGQHVLNATELAQVQQIIATLPPSNARQLR